MIDFETTVFSTVATEVRAQYEGAYVTGEAIAVPPKFPCVTIVEADNSTYERTLDSSQQENHARVMYEVNVYSNLSFGKKTQCRAIIGLIDGEMQEIGFVRVGSSPMDIPNTDKTIYRQVARYKAVISKDGLVYHK